MENELTCCVCLELYSQPLMLPCFHNFCRKCLEDLYRHSANAPEGGEPERRRRSARLRIITCPKCRQQATLDTWKGISSLPENKALENIVNLFSTDSSNPEAFPKCRMHDGLRLCHYCQTCKKSLCEECVAEQHTGFAHNVGLLQQFITSEKVALNANIREFDAVTNRIKLNQDEISQLLSDLEAKKTLAHMLVKEHFSAITSCLHVQKMKLVGEIDDSTLKNTKPILALRAKYNGLTSEMRTLKDSHQEVMREKNLAWKLKRLQDLSLRCSTFLTFRAGNIPAPPENYPDEKLGDLDIATVLTALRQLRFSQNKKEEGVVAAVQDVSTQTDAVMIENISEKDDNMNVGDRKDSVLHSGQNGSYLLGRGQLGSGSQSQASSQGHVVMPTTSSQITQSSVQIQSETPGPSHSQEMKTTLEQAEDAAQDHSRRISDLTLRVYGRRTKSEPESGNQSPRSRHDASGSFTDTAHRLEKLTLGGPGHSSRGQLAGQGTDDSSEPGPRHEKSAGDERSQSFVFGDTQHNSWPTDLSHGKDLFKVSNQSAPGREMENGHPLALVEKCLSKPQKPTQHNSDHSDEEAVSGTPFSPPLPTIHPASRPAVHSSGSEPLTNVVTSAGQMCGIGARLKTRLPQSAVNDDKNMGAALKEGFNSAMCTLKSLCRVGTNVTTTDTPGRPSYEPSALTSIENIPFPRVGWPENNTSSLNNATYSNPSGPVNPSVSGKYMGSNSTTQPFINTPVPEVTPPGQTMVADQPIVVSVDKVDLLHLPKTEDGPRDKTKIIPPSEGGAPFVFNSVNGNNTAPITNTDRGAGCKLESSSNGLNELCSPQRARKNKILAAGLEVDSPSPACDNSTTKLEPYETASESEPDQFHTPDEAFHLDNSPPLFTVPTFNMGTCSPSARPKLRKHMMKKRR